VKVWFKSQIPSSDHKPQELPLIGPTTLKQGCLQRKGPHLVGRKALFESVGQSICAVGLDKRDARCMLALDRVTLHLWLALGAENSTAR
jgi:hypothetical protein